MSKQLFVTDLDGTLLGADSRVSARSAAIISDLTRRGALITVATARTPATVEPLLHATHTGAPAVVMTGAALWDRTSRTYLSAQRLAPQMAPVLHNALRGLKSVCPMVYTMRPDGILDLWHPTTYTPTQQRFLDERSKLQYKQLHHCSNPWQHLEGNNAILLLAMGEPAEIEEAAANLAHRPELSVSHYTDPLYPTTGFLEVFGPEVSKAEGIQRLKALTGATHVTVFGDNTNDLPMMAVADHAVAVGNALDIVKASAHEVIGPNTADSVALYIQSVFCQN